MLYGYARVSSRDQNEDRQVDSLTAFGVESKHIYVDKQSGKDFNRPRYRALTGRLKAGDVLAIPSIDRLGRNYEEILEQWRVITREKNAEIVVLDMPLLDTRNRREGLTGAFIADLVLQILSYVAQTERENIKKRQAEGIRAAIRRGVRFGAPPKPTPPAFPQWKARYLAGTVSARAAARALGVSHDTFRRWVRER